MQRKRRPQEQRTLQTRGALIEATIDLIMARGMRGAAVKEICKRAGVTTGAIQHHFGSKAGLMAEVVKELFSPTAMAINPINSHEASLHARIELLVEYYWAIYGNDRYIAILENLMATRHDEELMKLVAVLRQQQQVVLEEALATLFQDVDLSPQEMMGSANTFIDYFRGFSVRRLYERSEAIDQKAKRTAFEILERDFAPHTRSSEHE